MHITLETDYAVRIIDHLSSAEGIQDAASIAEQTNVSLRFSLKILRALAEKGIVKSFKGAKGGYIIARLPGDITLLEVIEAIEGRYRFSRCVGHDTPCSGQGQGCCRFYRVYDEISDMVRKKLAAVTFEDI